MKKKVSILSRCVFLLNDWREKAQPILPGTIPDLGVLGSLRYQDSQIIPGQATSKHYISRASITAPASCFLLCLSFCHDFIWWWTEMVTPTKTGATWEKNSTFVLPCIVILSVLFICFRIHDFVFLYIWINIILTFFHIFTISLVTEKISLGWLHLLIFINNETVNMVEQVSL